MSDEVFNLRKTLSANIKKYRAMQGISQEKLAAKAEISANMVNDIEGCRTWVSDKTLISLANALKIETYMLLLPISIPNGDTHTVSALELACELQSIKRNFDIQFEDALKSKGLATPKGAYTTSSTKKYAPLTDFLAITPRDSEVLTFTEIEKIIGGNLPDAATNYRQWWENEKYPSHSQACAWLDAGWKVEHVILGEKVTFRKA